MRAAWLTALCVGCSASTASVDPLDWQKVTGSTTDTGLANGGVLGLGAPGAFDQRANFTVDAFKDGSLVRLYYGGADDVQGDPSCGGINDVHWRIGLATSTDGINFTRVPGTAGKGAILDNGGPNDFDSFLTYRPVVIKDGSLYRMWYNGSTHPFNCPTTQLALDRRIGYAESADGVHFTKMNDGPGPRGSVLPLGPPGSIDAQQVGYVWVLKDTNDYKMYYSANDNQNFWRVALATSTDARHWTKVAGKQNGGSIVDVGPLASNSSCTDNSGCAATPSTPICNAALHQCTAPDHFCAYQPTVYKESNQLYRMWYRGCQGEGNPNGPSLGSIQYAESNDGITWVKVPQKGRPFNGALGPGAAGTFDSGGLTTPAVFLDGASWNMYYAGFDTRGQFSTGLARATAQ